MGRELRCTWHPCYKGRGYYPALEAAKQNTDAPTVIEFMVATEEIVLPMVPGGNPMNNMILKSK